MHLTVTSPRVLNGMMAALLSLHDFYVRNQDPEAKTLFDRGILALEAEIHLYDDEGYSFYSMRGNPSGHYHGHHVGQLEALVSITGSRVLDEFREKWASYSLAGQLMKYPTAESLVIISLNFLALVGGFSLLILAPEQVPETTRPARVSLRNPSPGREHISAPVRELLSPW